MPLADCHLHTELSGDSRLHLEWLLPRAAGMGLEAVCPAEHYDPDPTHPWMAKYSYTEAVIRHQRLQKRFPQIQLGLGVEISYRLGYEEQIARFLATRKFDVVIGSVHDIGRLFLKEWLAQPKTQQLPMEERFQQYFDLLNLAARSGLFPILGHVDYIKKYAPDASSLSLLGHYGDILAEIFVHQLEHGGIIEINIGGLRYACEETYPSREILGLYKDMGGTVVTLGSDAHAPEDLRIPLSLGAKLAEEVGLVPIHWDELASRASHRLSKRNGRDGSECEMRDAGRA